MSLTDGLDVNVAGGAIEVFLGDVINSDNDANDEQIVLQLDLVTENVAGNQAGTALNNQGSLRYFQPAGAAAESHTSFHIRDRH